MDKRRLALAALVVGFGVAALLYQPRAHTRTRPKPCPPVSRVLKADETAALLGAVRVQKRVRTWHPPHVVKVWTAVYKKHVFRVVQLPHCEHIETVIAYNPCGESVKQAKMRNHGIAACSGSFHNPKSMALADFVQQKGSIISCARTGRPFVSIGECGRLDISQDYVNVKRKPGVSALALGQRLVPLERDGFSLSFMNQQTDRMAVGLNSNFIFIVQGRSDIWTLSKFMQAKLPVQTAINCDGGHVVRGKGPVHLVFRWKKQLHPVQTRQISGQKRHAVGQ